MSEQPQVEAQGSVPLALYKKILNARKDIEPVVKKDGRNSDVGYRFSRSEDVVIEANRVLTKRGVLYLPDEKAVETWFKKDGPGALVKLEVTFEVIDTTSGDSVELVGIGYGFDKDGDKAVYKAKTGAKKYFLQDLLAIPVVDADPEESDALADESSPEAERIAAEQDADAECPDVPPLKRLTEQTPVPDYAEVEAAHAAA